MILTGTDDLTVMKEDIDTLKNDWLTDNVRSSLFPWDLHLLIPNSA